MKPNISTQRNILDWPLDRDLTDVEIIQRLGVYVTDENGKDITESLSVNRTQVNFRQKGTYQVVLTAVDQHGNTATKSIEADVAPMRSGNEASGEQTMKNNQKKKKGHKGLIAVVIIIILLLAIFFGVRSHQRNVAQQRVNESQSSQLKQNSSSIKHLSSENAKLAKQLAALTGAVAQYEKDHNQQDLRDRLNNLEQQNNDLKNQLSQSGQEKVQVITDTARNIAQNPSQAKQDVQQLKQDSRFDGLWGRLTSQVKDWLDNLSNN